MTNPESSGAYGLGWALGSRGLGWALGSRGLGWALGSRGLGWALGSRGLGWGLGISTAVMHFRMLQHVLRRDIVTSRHSAWPNTEYGSHALKSKLTLIPKP